MSKKSGVNANYILGNRTFSVNPCAGQEIIGRGSSKMISSRQADGVPRQADGA